MSRKNNVMMRKIYFSGRLATTPATMLRSTNITTAGKFATIRLRLVDQRGSLGMLLIFGKAV